MSILDNFTRHFKHRDIAIPRRELVLFAISLIKEADRIEQMNTGSPGKAAIEFLLNTKYRIIENKDLQIHSKDLLLAEIDGVINKFVQKYKVKKKGKEFIFAESLEPLEIIICNPDAQLVPDLISKLHQVKCEIEELKIQLAKTTLNSSACLRLKGELLAKEHEAKVIKVELTKQKYFSHYDDQKSTLYRRSIGESKKTDSAKAGAVVGGTAGAALATKKFKKDTDFYRHRKEFQDAHKAKSFARLDLENAHNKLSKATHDRVGQKVIDAAQKDFKVARDTAARANKSAHGALETMKSLQKGANKKMLVGGLKGAALGAAAGLAAYGTKKLIDKQKGLKNKLEHYINKTRR